MVELPSPEALLEPFRDDLGRQYDAYRNHVLRQRALCDLLGAEKCESDTRLALTIAAAFHDLGIWTDKTWDYLEPSLAIADGWLTANGRDDLRPLVARLIREHHGLRARGSADDPVEIFRRADVIEVGLGLRRYGVSFASYRELLREHPTHGFHRFLIGQFFKNLIRHPLKPAPMFKL